MKWTNGKHQYKGKRNSRSQRFQSKLFKGMKINKKQLKKAFKQIENEIITRELEEIQAKKKRLQNN